MTPISIALFAASLTGFVTAVIQYGRISPKVEDYQAAVEGYLKHRLDETLASASPERNLRERILRLIRDRDFKTAITNLMPTSYFKAIWLFVSSGVLALIALILDWLDWSGGPFAIGIAIPTMMIGAYLIYDDTIFYARLDKIIRAWDKKNQVEAER